MKLILRTAAGEPLPLRVRGRSSVLYYSDSWVFDENGLGYMEKYSTADSYSRSHINGAGIVSFKLMEISEVDCE
jgi:hypothetical protein